MKSSILRPVGLIIAATFFLFAPMLDAQENNSKESSNSFPWRNSSDSTPNNDRDKESLVRKYPELNSTSAATKLVAPYIAEDTSIVLSVDLNADLFGMLKTLTTTGLIHVGELSDLKEAIPEANQQLVVLRDAGIKQAFALFSFSDSGEGIVLVIPVEGNNHDKALQVFKHSLGSELPAIELTTSRDGATILASTNKQSLQKIIRGGASPQKQQMLSAAFESGYPTQSALKIALLGNDFTRRMLAQAGALPPPFDRISGSMIARDVDWVRIEQQLGPQPETTIVAKARTPDVAASIGSSLTSTMNNIGQMLQVENVISATDWNRLVNSVKGVAQDGSIVNFSTEGLFRDMTGLTRLLEPMRTKFEQQGKNARRLQNLQQLALAMHNHHDEKGHFPPQASHGRNPKKRLLSWRVQILPYLGEEALFNQFHHDERWDSRHNLSLVKKMPDVFKNNNTESEFNNSNGKTVYVVPTGEGLMFDGSMKVNLGFISDGSANTAMLAAFPAEMAVPWTQPIDWKVDLQDPAEIFTSRRVDSVAVALADGSVRDVPTNAPRKFWQRMIHPRDGRQFNWEDLER